MDSSELGFKLRKEFGDWGDGDFAEPNVENVYGEYGDFQLVGHGKVTNSYCGKFFGFIGCNRVDLHNKITLDGRNCKNKVYVHRVFNSCNKPSCPVCYKYGWAVRQAGKIEMRLKEASKHFGKVEHIVASVPVKDYGLTHRCLRRKVIKILKSVGVVGGVLIFHAFRYNIKKQWYFSPHFHVLGFVVGGYSRCRHCKGGDCYACDGFEGRVYRAYRHNGYIIRVLGERKTVGGTAWYQLNHASIKKNVKRFHVATWFGVCSYRKLKVTVEYKKRVCPICQHDLVSLRYFGDKRSILDCFFSDADSCDKRCSFEDYVENGRVVWVERVKPEYGSGSYERQF